MSDRTSAAARHAHRHTDDEPLHDSRTDLGSHADIGATDAAVDPVDPDGGDDDSGEHGSNVRVIVRIRPLLESELAADHACTLIHVDGDRVRMDAPQPVPAASSIQVQSKDNVHRFAFDAVLGPQATQAELFRAGGVDQMLTQLLKGYHGTIFAYGQTGSGKTHTMDGISYSTKQVVVPAGVPVTVDGEPGAHVKSKLVRVIKEPSVEDSGLSLRCINELFAMIAAKQTAGDYAATGAQQYTVKCSFIQIYQESVFDLLTDAAPLYVRNDSSSGGGGGALSRKGAAAAGLRIRWSQSKDFYVENLYIFECKSAKEARNYFLNGMKKRLVASHRMNASSSRSHCIFTLYLEQKPAHDPEQIITSKLSLVDLAGSERVALTGATGNVLQQSIGINKSLFVLRKVIKSLARMGGADGLPGAGGKVVHPYRDSTLTRLLKHSLGGNSITLMVSCLSPSDAYTDENLSTLNYAGLTKHIANNVHINEDPKTALIRKLRAEIKMLRGMLARAHQNFSIGGGTTGGNTGQQQQLMPASSSYLSPTARSGSVSSRSQISSSQQQLQPYQLHSPSSSASSSAVAASSADPTLSQKIIESVGIIKALLSDNSELRVLYDTHASQLESIEFSNLTLSAENNELRERIHFLESVITEGHAAEHDIMRSPTAAAGAAGAQLEEIVVAADDEETGAQRDMAFEMEALREENQRLKGLMIASADFGSSSSSSSGNGSRTARGAQLQQQQPQRTHSALGHHAPSSSSSSQQPQYVLNQSAQYASAAAPAYSPSSSAAPASRAAVYSSSSSSSSASRPLNEGTSHPSTVYRPNSSQLQTLTSLQGRKGRTTSNGAAAGVAKKTAAPIATTARGPPPQQLQQQQPPMQSQQSLSHSSHFSAAQAEWERQRLLELDRDRFGSESPLPSATNTAARHTHAWDARPAGAQPFSNVARAASTVVRQPNSGGSGGGSNNSLLQAALTAQPVSLQLGTPSSFHRDPPNLMHSASLNPAIVAYMQQMQSQQTGRASNASSSQSRARY